MVDIHSHILSGMDDGAKTLSDSLAMVRMAKEAGTTDLVATPHANLNYKYQPSVVEERLAELREAAGDSAPRLHTGCDFHLAFDNIQDALANPRKYTIGHGSYLLVEFSDLAIFHTTTAVFENLLAAGMIPVITHPERNALLRMRVDSLREWVGMGCVIQVTAQSFLGRWGNSAQQFSAELMKRGLVHVVASDGHDTVRRPPVLDEAHRYLTGQYGAAAADRLLMHNPSAIVDSRPLPPCDPEPAVSERRWYKFWG
jgi:protein-tyrosine phosphatase